MYYVGVWVKVRHLYSKLCVCVCYRTLLALGCHVGLADEHAVEKVKSMKLSPT